MNLNKVQLIGRLGADPDMRSLSATSEIARLRICTSETFTRNGQKQTTSEWHTVCVFGKAAEVAKNYLHKGDEVYVEGKIHYGEYVDKNGQKRATTEINCFTLQLGARKTDRAAETQQSAAIDDKPPMPTVEPDNPYGDDLPF